MKTIENKTTTIALNENTFAKYGDLLISILNRPLSKSIDLKSMRRDLRLFDIFDAKGESFELNDEDFKYVATLVDESEWVIKHKDIIAFADYIDSLK